MKLIPNWQAVLMRAWSMRFWAAALACELGAQLLPYIAADWTEQAFRAASVACIIGGMGARLIDQGIRGGDDADRT